MTAYPRDIETGAMVTELKHHREVVRDVSWSPRDPLLVTTSWDGTLVLWGPGKARDDDECGSSQKKQRARMEPRTDRLNDWL